VEGWGKKPGFNQRIVREESGVLTVRKAFRSKKSPSIAHISRLGAKGKQNGFGLEGY
jgi:hypothetical protein